MNRLATRQFGMIGVLAGDLGKLFCVPLSIKIHDGDKEIQKWDVEPAEANHESHVVRIIRDASQAARNLGKSLLLLDRATAYENHLTPATMKA